MSCPFLARLNSNYIHNYAPVLLKNYGFQCPVASHVTSSILKSPQPSSTNIKENVRNNNSIPFDLKNDVSEKRLETGMKEGEIPKHASFPYETFFHNQIVKKKNDYSYRVFRKVNRLANEGKFPMALEYSRGEELITIWCSNDYLGMSCHPEVKKAVHQAVDQYGAGAGGTRNISGNSLYHEKLEICLAKLHQKEAALLFTSCFVANDSTLFTLAKSLPGCHIFSDAGNHASMIQGIRNSQVPKHIFKHNDPAHLRELLSKIDISVPKIVAFESVHSMTGAVCPLEQLCNVAHEFGALTFVDEVHAVGLYGKHGAGIGEKEDLLHKMDIISATLGKAFGNIGGYIVGSSLLIDMIRSYAAGFIFTTSLPPTVLCGALRSVEILASEEGRKLRARHQYSVRYLRKLLQKEGFPVEHTSSHIIPIKIGDPLKCTQVSDLLIHQYGHYVQAINYPTVARGQEKLRIAPTPYHTPEMINTLIGDMKKVWKYLDMELTGSECTEECTFCRKPILLDQYEARIKGCTTILGCLLPNCPQTTAFTIN